MKWQFVTIILCACAGSELSGTPGPDSGTRVPQPLPEPAPHPEPQPTPLPPPPPLPLPAHIGLVTSPRHGAQRRSSDAVVAGVYERGGASVVVERWDAPGHAWVQAGTGTTDTTGVNDGDKVLYRFQIGLELGGAAWPAGGLVSLRARVGDTTLLTLDDQDDTRRCLNRETSVRAQIANCATGLQTLTLVDTDASPPTEVHRYLDSKGATSQNDAEQYYLEIDAPRTVSDFISMYGLNDPQTPTLTYYNLGDLATGREIRCRRFSADAGIGVACTTFNYGVFGSDAREALGLAVTGSQSGIGTGSFANVSMIYDPPITAPNAVKFIVYNAQGALQTQARLDTRGDNEAIPNNCINCHGSDASYDPARRRVTGARFLPFDPSAFVFANDSGFTREDQEDTMRALNRIFLATQPSDTMVDTVRSWYGGVANLQGEADTSVVPTGWRGRGDAALYRAVIGETCRGCHASRSDALAFATPEQFRARSAQIIQAICGTGKDAAHAMPSAEASLLRFWNGPARAYLAGFLGVEAVGTCVAPE